MANFFDNLSCFSRLLGVVSVLGRSFTSLASVFNVVQTFVCGEDVGSSVTDANELSVGAMNVNSETQASTSAKFSAYVENMFYLYPEVFASRDSFKSFNEFCGRKGYGFSAVLVSNRTSCRSCGRKLLVCDDGKDVVIYHMTRGTYMGSRFTKKCTKCKIQEHYGFYKRDGRRMFEDDCLTKEFLLTSEDTAIDMTLLKYLDEEVVQGACPFLLKAKVYNSVHGYSANEQEEESNDLGEDGVMKPRKKSRYVIYKTGKIIYFWYFKYIE